MAGETADPKIGDANRFGATPWIFLDFPELPRRAKLNADTTRHAVQDYLDYGATEIPLHGPVLGRRAGYQPVHRNFVSAPAAGNKCSRMLRWAMAPTSGESGWRKR
jgi:hypothetical protein